MITLQHAKVELTDPNNAYGSLKSASLELRCSLIPVVLEVERASGRPITAKLPRDSKIGLYLDDEERCKDALTDPQNITHSLEYTMIPLTAEFRKALSNHDERKQADLNEKTLNAQEVDDVCCLVVEQVSPRTFIRWGTAWFKFEDAKWIYNTWKESMKENGEIITLI